MNTRTAKRKWESTLSRPQSAAVHRWTAFILVALLLTAYPSIADETQYVEAIVAEQAKSLLVEASFSGSESQAEVAVDPMNGFASSGSAYLILSTGTAVEAFGSPSDSASTSFGGAGTPNSGPEGYTAYDKTTLALTFSLPSNADTLGFVFAFGTEENPGFLGSPFQDFFEATIQTKTGEMLAQIAFLPDGSAVTVDNAAAFSVLSNVVTTSMNAMTQPISIEVSLAEYAGEELVLVFELADASDHVLDSIVLLDALRIALLPVAEAPTPTPRVRIGSIHVPAGGGGATGTPGSVVELTLVNAGNADYVGPCDIKVGLAYDTNWVPEWCTTFDTHQFGTVQIPAGGATTVSFQLASLPEGAVEEFRERLNIWWTGYEDRDPETDFVGFIAKLEGLPEAIDYAPLP